MMMRLSFSRYPHLHLVPFSPPLPLTWISFPSRPVSCDIRRRRHNAQFGGFRRGSDLGLWIVSLLLPLCLVNRPYREREPKSRGEEHERAEDHYVEVLLTRRDWGKQWHRCQRGVGGALSLHQRPWVIDNSGRPEAGPHNITSKRCPVGFFCFCFVCFCFVGFVCLFVL